MLPVIKCEHFISEEILITYFCYYSKKQLAKLLAMDANVSLLYR